MKRKFGLRRHSITPQAKAIAKLDAAFSVLVRNHYLNHPCFTCDQTFTDIREADCGHFRRRECMRTRFDPRNVGIQSKRCNRFDGGRSYEFGLKLDEIWGTGTASLMQKLSRIPKLWDVGELEQLTAAAKIGWHAYTSLYWELNPDK